MPPDAHSTQPMPTTTLPYADQHGSGRGVVPVPPAAPPGRPRRRGSPLAVVLVVLAIVAGLLIAGDRFGHDYAERTAATQLQTQLGLADTPSVRIDGVPFLTQLAASTFGRVVVEADQVPLDASAGGATVDHLSLTLGAVHPRNGFQRYEVGRADGWAQLGWPAVVALADGQNVRFDGLDAAGQGRVLVTVSQQVLGNAVNVEVRATPQLDQATQTIVFADPAITVLGIELPASVSEALLRNVLAAIPLSLPLGLRADGLTITADGARVELTGENLVIG